MARHLNFDRQQTLIAAMELFWHQGYAQTSIADLVNHLGINRFSLYNTYGDKLALYRQALTCYLETVSRPSISQLLEQQAGSEQLISFIKKFIAAKRDNVNGCFIQNAVLECGLTDEVVLAHASSLFTLLEQAFSGLITHAIVKGEMTDDIEPAKVSRFLVMQLQGIVALSKAQQFNIVDDSAEVLFDFINSLKHR